MARPRFHLMLWFPLAATACATPPGPPQRAAARDPAQLEPHSLAPHMPAPHPRLDRRVGQGYRLEELLGEGEEQRLQLYPRPIDDLRVAARHWYRERVRLVGEGKLREDLIYNRVGDWPTRLWPDFESSYSLRLLRKGLDPDKYEPIPFEPRESRAYSRETWTSSGKNYDLIDLGTASARERLAQVSQAYAKSQANGRRNVELVASGKFRADLETRVNLTNLFHAAIFDQYNARDDDHSIVDVVDVFYKSHRGPNLSNFLVLLEPGDYKLDVTDPQASLRILPHLLATAQICPERPELPDLPLGSEARAQWRGEARLLPFMRRAAVTETTDAAIAEMRKQQGHRRIGEISRFVRFKHHDRRLRRAFLRKIFEETQRGPAPLGMIVMTVDSVHKDWFSYLPFRSAGPIDTHHGAQETLMYIKTDSREFKRMMSDLQDDSKDVVRPGWPGDVLPYPNTDISYYR